ncbi:MAG: PAS domain S-box protein, partial [Promethearchaeota archaeon]
MENNSEKDLHYYFDSTQSIIVIINQNKKIDYINDFGAKILGYEKKELLGKDWFENIVPKINRQEIKNVFNNLMEGYVETFKSYLSPALVKDGTEKIISWKNSLIKNKNNRIIATLSIGDDITAHDIFQEEFKVQKDIKAKIIEASPVAITVVNQ